MTSLKMKSIKGTFLQPIHQYWLDISIIAILGIAFAVVSYLSSLQIPDSLINDFYAQDVWFGSDIPTVFGNISSLQSDFGRNNKHPLFPLMAFPLVFGVGKLLRLEPVLAARLVTAIVGMVWIGTLYVLFRLMRCQRLDATLFSLLGGTSAAAVFWFVVPESFSFGSLTILFGLVLVGASQYQKLSPVWYVLVGVATVGVTITNWMVGILATIVNYNWKKTLQVTGVTFLVANALWIFQRTIFRNSGYPFSLKTFVGEKKFMSAPESDSILGALASFAYKTVVMPAIQVSDSLIRPDWVKLAANPLALGSGGVWGWIAVLAWTGLLLLGLWGFFSTKQHSKLRLVLGLTLLGQIFLHSIYGTQETFIYSLHFAPLLLTVAAFSSLTRWRWAGLALTVLLVVSAGINNRSQFNQVTATLSNYGTAQQQVQAQMRLRPTDPWLRNAGHVILASPGSRTEEKAYHEPGGSFSPSPGSFGLSIWLVDSAGQLQATSDNLPLAQIQQQLTPIAGSNVPALSTKTDYYQATWTLTQANTWRFTLQPIPGAKLRPVIAVRSVGPAGGAVKSLHWSGQQLLVNDRWSIQPASPPIQVYLGSETSRSWTTEKPTRTAWNEPMGWGYARLEVPAGREWSLEIIDSLKPTPTEVGAIKVAANPSLNVPDPQFVGSVNAQISHLLMGLVGDRTRPSDPLSYPLPRLRDGAYQMVALARVGQLDVAKKLSTYFAETDFLDGVQFSADIPAISIWALTAVARQVQQPAYDRWLWPHIRRKTDLIVEMLSTNRPGYPIAQTSQVPFSEHPDFLTVDLVAGKMDDTPGLISLDLVTNIMSYRALQDAADLAERVNQASLAQRWRSQAAQLQKAWEKAFDSKFSTAIETYTSSLWPSWIAATSQPLFTQELQRRWQELHDATGAFRKSPSEPHLDIAETHQWLFLGQVDRVWSNLKWFWQHQASPGLYTWWGSNRTPTETVLPKSFSRWQQVRGWLNPPHVTPYYWTAAEMLLLQLDMLAYVDYSTSTPSLVIGAGVPPKWLNQPIAIKDLPTGNNLVSWQWDGKKISVKFQGEKMNVKLGAAFPTSTPIELEPTRPGNSQTLDQA